MNAEASPVPADTNDEVVGLIQALHKAEQRLEELTAGEVDTVADRGGRTLLLRRAQDRLRHSSAAKQAAILNALPAHIALLDAQGVIISMNEAWRCAGGADVLEGPGHGIGVNYIDICDGSASAGSSDGHQIAQGIRSVLAGVAKGFSVEYARYSLIEQRLFLLTVTPLGDDGPNGAVVMLLDVTAERLSERTLRVSELRFRQMAESIRDVFFLRSVDSAHIYYVSPAYERIWGRTCESLYLDPGSWVDSIHPDDRERALTSFADGENSEFDLEFRIVRLDGEVRWINARGAPILDDAGQPYRTAGVISDITERKQAEYKIKRLDRVHAMLSQVNAMIIRVRDRDELFRETCRIAIEAGGFKMAWIGMINPQTQEGAVVASLGGEQSYIDQLRLSAHEGAVEGELPACRALRQLQPVICNDVATDLSFTSTQNILLQGQHRSIGYFPLIVAGRPEALIALHAGEPDFFDAEEMLLLLELSGDVAFALDHIEKQERLDYLSYFDVLTGLANRSLFIERLTQYVRSAASGGHKLALLLIDLERFKNINDSLGQPAGDALLKQVGDWITGNVGDTNLVARLNADHFAVLLPEVTQGTDVGRLVETMLDDFLEHPFRLNDTVFHIAAKLGIALCPDDGADSHTLFRNAEAALKKAKATGNRYLFYRQEMTDTVAARLRLENQLRRAIERREFVLHYQPKVNLLSGKLTSAEALIRWHDPRTGLMPPGQFIPILEETGLIHEVGRWALQKAIEDYLRWRTGTLTAVRIAVNVSPLQLRNRGFITEIEKAIAVDAHAASGLELEITESLIMEDVEYSIASLQAIRAMGVTIAIDDFGTGFSSLSYLAKLPVDTLKIDRSFVTNMNASPEGLALASSIITLAHSLKLNVVAEGVETQEQLRLLRMLGCDEMQGFLFSKPLPRKIFETRYLMPLPPGEAGNGGLV
jgi:diguanylate cyclase (GGDEF)-like protein/PAS domain S-box-containing protein